jgi:hypothetical protein
MEAKWEVITPSTTLKKGDIIRQRQPHDTYRYYTVGDMISTGVYRVYWDGLDFGNLWLLGRMEIFVADKYEKKI